MTTAVRRLAPLFIIGISALLISLWIDPVIGGRLPQYAPVVSLARFFSIVGDGLFLFAVAGVLMLSGSALKRPVLKDAGRDGFFAVAASGIAVNLLKAAFERPRIEHADGAILKILENPLLFDYTGRFNSFPSGHTTISFALAFVLAKRFPAFRYLFYLAAALVAASRIYLGSHYPSDIVGAVVLGLLTGWLVSNKINARQRWALAALAFLAVFISFFKSGGFFLFDVDEAVFSEASREMFETGNLVTPTYNYEPRYDKPIFIYWLMSLAFKVLGLSEFAARFTSGTFGVLLASVTFLFVRRVKGFNAALFSFLALILSIEFFTYSHSAITDMTLTFFIASSIYAFYLAYTEKKPVWHYLFWAASAAAVLTKGAIGLLFPFTAAFLFLLVRGDLRAFKDTFRLSYIILFLLISVPWYATEFYVKGWEFFNAFILKHHIQRYSSVISSHGGPPYYYLGVLLLGFFPWVAFLPGAVVKAFRGRKDPDSGLYLLAGVWFVFVLVFFSIAGTKLPNYIFPLFPAAAVLAGVYVAEMTEGTAWRGALFFLILLALIFAVGLFALPHLGIKSEVFIRPFVFYALGGMFSVLALMAGLALFRPYSSFLGISGVMIFILIFLRLYVVPPVNVYMQKTLYEYSTYAGRVLGENDTLATYEINKPSIPFYARRKAVKIEKRATCDIKEYAKRGRLLVITTPKRLDELAEFKDDLKVIRKYPDYVLLGAGKFPPFR